MSSNDSFGLTDGDVKIALCALKVMLADGNGKVDKGHLAKLTGHGNPDSALRVWYMAKAKLAKGDSPSKSATSAAGVDTPTKKKTAAKKRTPTPKKRVKEQSEDEEVGEEEEVEKPALKRVKKETPEDAGMDMQGEI